MTGITPVALNSNVTTQNPTNNKLGSINYTNQY